MLAPTMQFYFYIIDRNYRWKMVKGTCLIALRRKDQSPRILDLEVFECRFQNEFS
jgi:hypothetical protein